MPMRVKVSGVMGQVIEAYGKFNYGDIVKIIKFKISKSDSKKNKVCVCDDKGCSWINMNNVKLMISEDYSI